MPSVSARAIAGPSPAAPAASKVTMRVRNLLRLTALLTAALLLIASSIRAQQASPAPQKESTPIGTLSVGYAYLWADQGVGYHSNLNGWLVKPTFNISNGWAAYADASNYYGKNRKGSVNLHTYSLGVSKEVFARPKLKPSLFLQMGDSRNSNAGSVVNAYALLTGVNFVTPLRKWVSLSIIPAEYVFTYPEGDPRNSFNAKFALVFPFGKKGK